MPQFNGTAGTITEWQPFTDPLSLMYVGNNYTDVFGNLVFRWGDMW